MQRQSINLIWLGLFFLILGAYSLIAQVAILREIYLSFYSNELWFGITLACWLLATGLGSVLALRIFSTRRRIRPELSFASLLLGTPLLFGAAFFLIRLARLLLTTSGLDPAFWPAIAVSLGVIIPLGFCLGCQFVLGSIFFSTISRINNAQTVSYAYAIESFGFVIGAVLYNFIIVSWASSTCLLLLSGALWLVLLFGYLLIKRMPRKNYIIIGCLLAANMMLLTGAEKLGSISDKWLFPKEDIIATAAGPMGVTNITRLDEQINVYYNGSLYTSSADIYERELKTHLPMLAIADPRRVLIIGQGFAGYLTELNKYNLDRIDYLEPDQVLYKTSEGFFKSASGPAVDEKLNIIFSDARTYLSDTDNKYDLIILNLPEPDTISANRFFTYEYYDLLSGHLSTQGLLIFTIAAAPNLAAPLQTQKLGIIRHTLKQVFPQVNVLVDNEVVFLASHSLFEIDFAALAAKYDKLKLNNKFVFPAYIEWLYSNPNRELLAKQLEQAVVRINRNFSPVLYSVELKIFIKKTIERGKIVPVFTVLALLVAGLGVILIKMSHQLAKKKLRRLLIGSAGLEFCLLSLEVMLLLIMPLFKGFLFGQVALIIALVIFGIAFGSLLAARLLYRLEQRAELRPESAAKYLIISPLILIITILIAVIAANYLQSLFNYFIFYYLLAVMAGFSVGFKFPWLNSLWLSESENLGLVYGIDLIGAALGAAAISIIILPLAGVKGALLILLIISLLVLGLFKIFKFTPY